jgi:hypothetical protein
MHAVCSATREICRDFMYYLKHEQQCFIRNKDGLINSSKFIGEVTFKKLVVYVEKIKVKVYVNKEISITYKDTTRL